MLMPEKFRRRIQGELFLQSAKLYNIQNFFESEKLNL